MSEISDITATGDGNAFEGLYVKPSGSVGCTPFPIIVDLSDLFIPRLRYMSQLSRRRKIAPRAVPIPMPIAAPVDRPEGLAEEVRLSFPVANEPVETGVDVSRDVGVVCSLQH